MRNTGLVAKRSARSTRIKSLNQIRHLGFTAPDELRDRLGGVSGDHLAGAAAALRPRVGGDTDNSLHWRTNGRPTAQWSRLAAGRSDDLGSTAAP